MCLDTHEDGPKEVTVSEVLGVVTVKITVVWVIPLRNKNNSEEHLNL
jgi:hypothetical protein